MTNWCLASCQSLDGDRYCVNQKAVEFFHIIFLAMPHPNICNLTASMPRIVLVATKKKKKVAITAQDDSFLHVQQNWQGKFCYQGPGFTSVSRIETPIALSVAVSELAQAKSHLNITATGNTRDFLHLMPPVVQDFGFPKVLGNAPKAV